MQRYARFALMTAIATAAILVTTLPASAEGELGGGELDGEMRDLTWVGFQQFQEASRVFIRTTDKATYRIDSSREKVVAIILENTRVPLFNNTRYLACQYFDSPIIGVQPRVIEGPSPSVRIEIRLRHKVPFKETQNDNVISLDFER